jgi:hypothetical protein
VRADRPAHTRLPLLYFGLAHAALAAAFAAIADLLLFRRARASAAQPGPNG